MDQFTNPHCRAAYFAGLMDGEGYIGIRTSISRRQRAGQEIVWRRFAAQVQITNCYHEILAFGARVWGGSLHEYPGVNKPVWKWQIPSRSASALLTDLLPFLVIKREQALLVLELQSRIGAGGHAPRRMTPQERAYRLDLQARCRALNQRSYYGKYV